MNCEQLSLQSFIDEMKEVTDGFHPRKFCFVLGAGASRSSGIKSGQELVKIWDRELRERNAEAHRRWRGELSITDENMSSFYSQYYEQRFRRCPTDGYNYIEKIMESATPSAGYVMLAHLLTRTTHNVVITTNFDHLTEDAVNYYAQNTPLVIGHESLSHYVTGQPVRPTVIKIHRDLLFDPKSRSEDLERLPDSWKSALERIFLNYHPVFIGYAGNDKSLMDFLTENADKFSNDEWKFPYWMLYKTDKLEGRVADFLDKSRGFYIFHGGFDEVMIQLGAAFDYKVPSEEDFLEDAKNRYRALADAIDALSDAPKMVNVAEVISTDMEKPPQAAALLPEKSIETEVSVNQAIEKITSQSDQQRMYREATNLLRGKEYARAAKILERLIELDEGNARYHMSLGDAFYHLNKNEESLAEYNRALELDPQNVYIYQQIAFVYFKMDQYEDVSNALHKAISIGSESENFHFITGIVFETIGALEDALSEFSRAAELNPRDYINRQCIAEMLVKLNQNEEAVEEAQRAIALRPDYPEIYEIQAKALRALGRNDEADQAEKKAAELRAKESKSKSSSQL